MGRERGYRERGREGDREGGGGEEQGESVCLCLSGLLGRNQNDASVQCGKYGGRGGGGVRAMSVCLFVSQYTDSSPEIGTHNQYDGSVQWGK